MIPVVIRSLTASPSFLCQYACCCLLLFSDWTHTSCQRTPFCQEIYRWMCFSSSCWGQGDKIVSASMALVCFVDPKAPIRGTEQFLLCLGMAGLKSPRPHNIQETVCGVKTYTQQHFGPFIRLYVTDIQTFTGLCSLWQHTTGEGKR